MKKSAITLLFLATAFIATAQATKKDTVKKPMPVSGYIFSSGKPVTITLNVPFTVKAGDLDAYIYVVGQGGPDKVETGKLHGYEITPILQAYQRVVTVFTQPIADSLASALFKGYNRFITQDKATQKADSLVRAKNGGQK